MAKQKQPKMKPAEAVQVLANEVNQMKSVVKQMTQDLIQSRAFLQEVARVLESYIEFDGKQDSFTKYMIDLGEQAKKEQEENDNQRNEQADGKDTDGDKENEGVRAEGVRT
jgi:Na+/phosphate symporter